MALPTQVRILLPPSKEPATSRPSGAPRSVLRPNATCPVCGAKVHFYANEHGSRVFFDEVGPPWPKHPCTATALWPWRQEEQPLHEGRRIAPRGFDTASRRWVAAGAFLVSSVAEGDVVVVRRPGVDGGHRLALQGPTDLRRGDVVFWRGSLLSHLDRATVGVRETKVLAADAVALPSRREEAERARLFARLATLLAAEAAALGGQPVRTSRTARASR